MLTSAIYEGSVRHRRRHPKTHEFDFRFFMLFLDLDELKQVFQGRWFWSTRKWSLCRFRESDHLIHLPRDLTLRERCLKTLRDHGVDGSIGPIRLLTQLSYLGFSMNPVSFFYCYDTTASRILAIVAEVNNTPWGEQHTYVIPASAHAKTAAVRSKDIAKEFHVSPFMTMDLNYRMAFSAPDRQLAVRIENHARPPATSSEGLTESSVAAPKLFDVTMALRRRPIAGSSLNWLLIKYPAISFQVFAGIYWQALLLAIKRIPFVPHPRKRNSPAEECLETTNDGKADNAPCSTSIESSR